MLANAEDDFPRAARWFGVAEELRKDAGTKLGTAGQLEYDREVDLTRARLDRAAFDAAWSEGRNTPLAGAVAEAET